MRYFLLLALLVPLSVQALNLKEVVQHVKNNEMLQSLEYAVKAQKKAKEATISAYLPKLSGSAAYQYIHEDQRAMMDYDMVGNLEANMVLFDGFARSERLQMHDKNILSAQENKAHQEETLIFNAIKLYFALQSTQANIKAKEQKQKELKNQVKRLERFYAAKQVSQEKVEQIKASYAMNDYELVMLEQNYKEQANALELLINKDVDELTDATLIETPTVNKSQEVKLTHDLEAMKFSAQALMHESKTKTSDYWPTVVVNDTFRATHYYEMDVPAQFAGAFEFPASKNTIQVQAKMTLFDFFGKSKEREVTHMQYLAKTNELAYKTRDQKLKQKFATIKLDTVRSKINAAQQSLSASQKSYELISQKYEANLVDNTTYLEALSSFYQSKALLSAAQNEYQTALAEYYYQNAIPLSEKIQ